MADNGRYSPLTLNPVPDAEAIARRRLAEIARQEEIEKRRLKLIREAEQQAASKEEDPGSVEGRQARKEAMRKGPVYAPPAQSPTKTTIDGKEVPMEQAIADIPKKMDFEERIRRSPIMQRALRRSRTEDLIAEGKTPEEAAAQAEKEQQERKQSFELGRARAKSVGGDGAAGFALKESASLAEDTVFSAFGPAARMLGYPQVADQSEAFRSGMQAEMTDWRNEKSPYPELQGGISGAASSAAQMVPGIAVGAVAGPAVGMGYMAGQFGAQEYSNAAYEGKEAGLSGKELDRYATIQGGIEAAIMPAMSAIPGLGGIESQVLRRHIARGIASNPSVMKSLAGGAVAFTKESAAELAEELITEGLHGLAREKSLDEEVDYGQIIKDTTLNTMLMMGLMKGGQVAGDAVANRMQGNQQPPVVGPAPAVTPEPATEAALPVVEQAPEQQPIAPAIEAFLNDPSARKYEAAIKAGLPPVEKSNREGRSKYAAELRKQRSSVANPQPVVDPVVTNTEQPETVVPVETPSGTVPNDELERFKQLMGEDPSGQEIDVEGQLQGSQGNAEDGEKRTLQVEGQEGRQEGLLNQPEVVTPADSQQSPAAHTKETFTVEYNDLRSKLAELGQSLEAVPVRERLAEMFDAQTEWASELETTSPPVVGPGGTSPGQSLPPDAGPAPSIPAEEKPKRYESAIKRYPAKIPDPYNEPGRPQREFDSPPIYLTGVSNAESRDAAKTMPNLGVMLTPRTQQYKSHLNDYQFFGVDNGAFTGKFNEKGFYKLLDDIREQGDSGKALFAAAPDVVGDWQATLKASEPHLDRIRDAGFPVAIVLQNGATPETVPWDRIDALFVGGDNNFKLAQKDESGNVDPRAEMFPIIKEAEKRGVPIHYGRVNSAKRLEMVHYGMKGKSADGTFLKFGNAAQQTEKVMSWLKPWGEFPKEKPQQESPRFPAPGRSLRSIVLSEGGISAKALRKDYNQQDLKGNGLLGIMRIKGLPLDVMAQTLESSGHLRTPADRNPADWLIEQLQNNADSAKAEYTDKEIEAQLKAEQEAHDRLKELVTTNGETESVEELRKRSEEAGVLAADEGQPDEGELSDAELEVIDTSFDFGANVEAAPAAETDDFKLEQPKKPKAKAEDFGTNDNTKQGGLFDAGKPGELPGQNLLFDSDPGDVGNPKTQENKAKAETPPADSQPEPSPEDLMEAVLREELLGEKPAKPKKERAPAGEKGPSKPRKPRTEAAKKRTEKTAEELKAAGDYFRQQFGKPITRGGIVPPLTKDQMRAAARLVKAALDHNVSKFNEFVAYVVDEFGPDVALMAADGIELAWRTLKRLPEYSGIDDAGKVADIVGAEKEVANEDRTGRDDAGDGGRQTAGRPLGSERMEEASAEDVPADAGGRDAESSGDAGGGRSETETSGTVSVGDEGTGSVSASSARNDRPARRSGRLDYRIASEDRIGEKFNSRERFDKNVEAIKVLKLVEAENRKATPEEQKVLAQYVGWGGLKEAFSTRDDQGLREKKILKELLTEQELASARTSVRNAHYTSPEVISAMWDGLTNAGFAGGRILEPSMGIGHFYGLVPESVADVSKLSGIEMDSLTARIAQQLYQTADIEHAPYQNVNVKSLQDLVISNVPFGQYKAADKFNKGLKRKESIHNFFFLKALTNVRPGGVVAFITSRYTMDTMDPSIREQITAAGGRFVGAVRLPNNAFMGIAKTKVTTDVIFIQKDAGDAQPWRNTIEDSGGFVFNEYYKDHPENVLGKIDPKGGTQMNEWGIAPDGHDIGKSLARQIAAMPFDRAALAENSTEDFEATDDIGEDSDVRDGRLSIRDGKLYKAVGGKLELETLWGGERGQERKFAIIRSMANLAAVRDKLSELETNPLATDAEIERGRKLLNTEYDKFVADNGFIHKGENQGLFRPDEQLPTLLALEEWDTDTKTAKKADVFEKRVQRPSNSATNPTTAEGAAVESYARLGRIDLPMMSEWLGKSEAQVEAELTGWAYKDPATGEWSLKNVYLSGNISKKLKEAETAAKTNPAFQKNVEDLKRVLPPRKTAGQIHVRPRSPFVKAEHYVQFMKHMGVNAVLRHDDFTGAWLMDNPQITDTVKAGPWGVGKKTAADLLEGLLNNKPPVVWGKDYKGDRVIDEAATQLARAKSKEIEDEFGRWIFSDPDRATQIEDGFNDTVGAYIEGDWDGSHLTLPGMNVNITLLPHQKNAIWRAIVTGNILLAHEVGLGKTFIMSAIAMERKRLGLATNQMFVVPNHLLSQWASEFKALYPSAKLLALESDQINSKNRRTLMERVKSGRFDAIIVTPEAYKKMPMSNEIVEAKLTEITQKIEDTIKEAKKAKGDNKNFVAKLESVLESIRGKMEKMLNDPAKDAGAKFDDLGIDAIYVDEAHEYRNLWSMTQMGDISGVGLEGNQKTFDMLLKTDYLNEKTNGRGIVFATGTPIANSISELYSMQRYLQPKTLAEAGVASFDDWANTFGEAVSDIEVDPTGSGFRSKTRFKEFRNTIALSKIFRQVADVKYAEDVGLDKVRPTLRGGKLQAIPVMPSVGLLAYVRNLVRRLEISKSRSFDKRIDNPLKVTTDGRKAALDMRLVVPEEDGISSKINHAVENVARIHREEAERKGAQLIWVNLGTPASAKKKKAAATLDPDSDQTAARMDDEESNLESGRINAYEDIKQKLIAQGIPENEIAFIHDHDDKDRKRALFQKVREGKVRILISTVKKLATGANIQDRLAAMHFLDPPWKPADIEQALGRAIRRGNKYKDWGGVQGFTYVTKGSFDAYIWQLLENKAKAIKQIMRGESDSVEDTGRIELNADEVKALASSNPKVLELVKVRNDVGQLRAEYYGYMAEQGNVQSQIAQITATIRSTTAYMQKALDELKALPSRDDLHAEFKVKIGKKEYSKRSEIGAAMLEAMPEVDSKDEAKKAEQIKDQAANPVKIGSALGYPIYAGRSAYSGKSRIIIGDPQFGSYFEPSDDSTGNGVKLFNVFDRKYDEPEAFKVAVAAAGKELEALKNRAGVKWPKSDRLKANEQSLNQLEKELGSDAGKKGELPVVSALTKFAIMAETLGRKVGRAVTFDGKQWMHGDRLPVNPEAVTREMELEVDREVALMLSDAGEAPVASFFFHETKDASELRVAAMRARAELSAIQLMNAKHKQVMVNEWAKVKRGSTPWTGLPISKEMSNAIAGRLLGSIKAGVKRFEVFVRELRADRELTEDLLNGIKPRVIRTWNAVRVEYGLDEATETVFDATLQERVDAEIQQAIETAKGTPTADPATQPAATQDPATLEPERTYSAKNAFTDSERARLGLPERQPKTPRPNEPLVELAAAMAKTEQGRADTDALIAELTVRPRATTPLENHQLTVRYAELDQKYDSAKEEQNAARRIGDDATEAIAGQEASMFLKQQTELLELMEGEVSYFLGAGLQARKTSITRNFSMARSVLEYETAFRRTLDPSDPKDKAILAAMEKQIADLAAANAELQRLLDERDSSIDDLNTKLKEAHDAAVNQKPQSRFAAAKERAQKKVNDAWAEVMGTLSMTTTNAQIVPYQNTVLSMVKLAGAYVELGVVSLPDFLDRVRKRMGPEAEKLIPQFTQGWNDFQASRTNDELEQITDKIDPMDDDTIGRAARDLHRFVIQRDGLDASAEGRNAAVVAVYEIMRDKVEGITEDQVARAMSGIGVYSELNKDAIEVIRRDQKAQLLLLEQIRDANRGELSPRTGQERELRSDEQRALLKVKNEAIKAAGIITGGPGQLRSALDAAKRMTRNRISDLTKAIESGQRIAVSRKLLTPDAELTALQSERDALQKLYDQAFGKGQLSDEQRANAAEKALDRAISKMEADLASGKLYSDPAKAPVSSPAIEAKRAALDAMKASREELRLSSGEAQARSDAAYERHLLEKDAELARRLAENDFMPAGKKPARELTPEMKRVMLEIQKKQEALLKRKKEWEFENRHPIYKFWKTYPVQGMSMVRKGLTTIDQSLIGRQGWLLGLAHPILYGKSIKKAFGSNWLSGKSIFPTEQDLFNAEQELDADADWVRLEKIAKLAVTGVHGGMKKAEENNSDVPEWFDKIPGIGGSERAGSAFINTQRRLVFRQLVSQLATRQEANGPSSVSTADLRVIANLINVSSGRATLGEHENAIKMLTAVFFSPRWWASRLMWLSGQPMWSNAKWAKGEGVSKEARQLVMKEWATQAATQAAVMTIAVAGLIAAFGEPGDDEEWDWYMNWSNPNFGRIRIGSTYIDMTAGLGQHIALFGQMYTGKRIDRWETKDVDKFRMVSNQIRGKLAPMPGIFADWLDGQSISQEPFGSTEWYASKAIPLSIQDVTETFKQEGVELGSIVSMLMFFGMGAQTREAKVKSRAEAVNEIRAMRKQGQSPETIQAALNKHLKYTAALEAKEKLRTASPDEKAALESAVAGESDSAIEKERQDITLRAIERLSTEDKTGKKAPKEDASITTARALLKEIAPTFEEADALFKQAYKARHGMLVEVVGGRYVPKKSVSAAKRRLRAMYQKN